MTRDKYGRKLFTVSFSGEATSSALLWLRESEAEIVRKAMHAPHAKNDGDVLAQIVEPWCGGGWITEASEDDFEAFEDGSWHTPAGEVVTDIRSIIAGRPQGITPTQRARNAFENATGTDEERLNAALDEYDEALDEWRNR